MGDAARPARLAVAVFAGQVNRSAIYMDAASARGHAAQNLKQFGLAVSSNPRDAQDLSGADMQRNAL